MVLRGAGHRPGRGSDAGPAGFRQLPAHGACSGPGASCRTHGWAGGPGPGRSSGGAAGGEPRPCARAAIPLGGRPLSSRGRGRPERPGDVSWAQVLSYTGEVWAAVAGALDPRLEEAVTACQPRTGRVDTLRPLGNDHNLGSGSRRCAVTHKAF